jgi:predicted RNase H-like nuclease (RuvC/YqgF family)
MPAQTAVPSQSVEPTVSILIERLNEIRSGFKQNLDKLRRNLEMLESERSGVLFEIEAVKKDAESKAVGLETEISQLREDITSLKELLGLKTESS